MGLFDKWTKKTEKEQLQAVEKKAKVGVEKKVVAKSAVTDKVKKDVKLEKDVKNVSGNAYKIIVRPLISEKAAIAEANSVYTFVVSTRATKIDIKKAIKQVYGVMPLKVRVINVEGKDIRFGRNNGKRSEWKKAIVTLPKGQSIQIHEGV